jgi:hypothetical protein
MTDSRWNTAAAAAPAGLALLVGTATWVTVQQPTAAPAPKQAASPVSVRLDGDHDSVEALLQRQLTHESKQMRRVKARIDALHARTQQVRASTPTGSSGGTVWVGTTTTAASGGSSGWQAPAVSSGQAAAPAPAPAPATHTTTGASSAPPP